MNGRRVVVSLLMSSGFLVKDSGSFLLLPLFSFAAFGKINRPFFQMLKTWIVLAMYFCSDLFRLTKPSFPNELFRLLLTLLHLFFSSSDQRRLFGSATATDLIPDRHSLAAGQAIHFQ